jgi:FKBP12-rapamycin complex-associated protein
MMSILLPRLQDGGSGIAASILEVVGCMAEVRGEDMAVYVDDLVPLIMDSLQDTCLHMYNTHHGQPPGHIDTCTK